MKIEQSSPLRCPAQIYLVFVIYQRARLQSLYPMKPQVKKPCPSQQMWQELELLI